MNTLRQITDRGIKVAAVDGKVKLSGLSALPPDEREEVIKLAAYWKQELLAWGEHAPLILWFLSVNDKLPTEPFCLWREGKCSLHWINPSLIYPQLVKGIQAGPDFEYANELVSILGQLKVKFGSREARQIFLEGAK